MPDHPPPDSTPAPATHPSRFRGVDGVTTDERDLPPVGDQQVAGLERAAAAAVPAQLDLFTVTDAGAYATEVGGLPPVSPHSSLALARTAYRRHLERSRRPRNTIESYSYDLQVFEDVIGPKPLNRIDRQDVARFLGEAHSKSTRKRRLTSLRRFFRYLIDDARALRFDPTEGYYPHQIRLRSPVPLFADEQADLLDAARADEPWSALAIWLMMRLGLTRAELLALERDHIDRTQPQAPVVHIVYDEVTKQSKERRLAADADFAELYETFLDSREIEGRLFPIGPQAVNGMVERVRRMAGITKELTPQTLRATFAVDQARSGADQEQLLALLGLVNDPRNRQSVNRYLALAADPLAIAPPPNP